MSYIKLDDTNTSIPMEDILEYRDEVKKIHEELHEKANDEKEFLGWLHLPTSYDKEEFTRIKQVAGKIQKDSDVLLCIGIGGSYLGARAVIESLTSSFCHHKENCPEIVYVGNNLSPNYLNDVIDKISNKNVSINVISKSGTTTEPAIAFRVFREFLESKYGIEEARKRIYVTTDKVKGALKTLAKEEGYETFVIPDDIGGRFSVITPVGLLPIAVAGIDIDEMMTGLKQAYEDMATSDLKKNSAYAYAVSRRILQNMGKDAEMFVTYEPSMSMVAEWWKQLFGESEGKDGKGILPCSATFSTDLHSLGQFIQEGKKVLYETLVLVDQPMTDLTFPSATEDVDGMNYLAGKSIDWSIKWLPKEHWKHMK